MKSIHHFVVVGCLLMFGAWMSQDSVQAQFFVPRNNFLFPTTTPASLYHAATGAWPAGPITNGNNPFASAMISANAQAVANQQMWAARANYNQITGAGNFNGGFFPQTAFNPQTPYVPPIYPQSPISPYSAQGSGYSPYSGSQANPYSPSSAGYGMQSSYTDPYMNNPYMASMMYGGAGQVLQGEAAVIRAYGSLTTSYEQARTVREQLNQARLKTKKDAFDLDMYIKQHTLSYTEEQARNAKLTLRRIQTNSLPGEITSGKAINWLLDDLRKYPGKKSVIEPMMLSDGVLSHLNVTKNSYGLGILRDDGKLTWPAALLEMLTINQRKDLDARIQTLVRDASNKVKKGQFDANVLKDVRDEMDRIREELVKKVNEVPTSRYLDAKRFLQEFHEASIALERGEAANQADFQRFVDGGKSVQDVVGYMIDNGLVFAPATANDEFAYRALHSILASYDVTLNAQLGVGGKE